MQSLCVQPGVAAVRPAEQTARDRAGCTDRACCGALVPAACGRHLAARGALRVSDAAHVRDGRPRAAGRRSDHVPLRHDGLDALVAGVLERLPDQVLQRPAARRLEAARHDQGLLAKLHSCTPLSRHCSILTPREAVTNSHAVRVDKQQDLP